MKAAILGTGLIGTSVGLGLRAAGWETAGWDPDPEALSEAGRMGAVDVATDPDRARAGADVVVLAAPPPSVVAVLSSLHTDALVTDVAGVKGPVVKAAAHLAHFVGGHPMAGREVSGPEAATPALFRGATWVLVTDGAAPFDLERAEDLVGLLGARPLRMTAEEHDDAVATISHLPQVLAASLVREAADHPAALGLAAGSFRDLTRVAASDPSLWADLLVANRRFVAAALESYRSRLARWGEAVAAGDTGALAGALTAAATTRAALGPALVAVRIALADQPGEIARVGHALERTGADVRDLQLRHAPYGGGGILTVSVRPGDADRLRRAVRAEGLLVVE